MLNPRGSTVNVIFLTSSKIDSVKDDVNGDEEDEP